MSLSILFGQSEDVAHWVCERIPYLKERIPYFTYGKVLGEAQALGVVDAEGAMLAGVVFHNWDPFAGNMEVSCAAGSPRWGNREIFRAILRYPFSQAQCTRLTALTPRRVAAGATSPRRFLEGLGFQREGSIRRAFGQDNGILYGLLREEWEAHPLNRGRPAKSPPSAPAPA